jgi:NAD(P)-dependent dehydrogenase (short-subunit alcohol dehydrogenase family)
MDLDGTRVVVLGGTSGIGLAVARAALSAGAEVVVASSRSGSVAKALAELGDGASGDVVDLLDAATTRQFLAGVGPFDHLVYTAGEALTMMPLDALEIDRARDFFQVRYFGALTAVQAARPLLRPGGSITLTSGTAGERPGPGWAVPASLCGATNSMTRALAVELAPLRVNAVAPGVVRSPLWSSMSEEQRERFYADLGAALPVGRVGEVDDIARAYLFCMTEPFATGSVFTVDGGAVLV